MSASVRRDRVRKSSSHATSVIGKAGQTAPNGHGPVRRPGNPAMRVSVLVLNRNYVAVHVFSVQRAFSLLWKGSAEVVNVEQDQYFSYDFDGWREISGLKAELEGRDESDDWIRSVQFEIQVPRVIRLLRYDRIPRNTVKFNRRNVFLRDEHCCQYCQRSFPRQQLSLDHVLPRSRGGEDSWENVVCACLTCNVKKGGRTPQEAGMTLKTRPVKPQRNPLISRQLTQRKYALWAKFLCRTE